jgi:hypothetical protein
LRRNPDYRWRYEQLIQDRGHKDIQEGEDGRRVHWRSPAEVLRQEFRVVVSVARGTGIPPDPRDSRPPLFEGVEIVYEVEVQPDPVKPPKILIEYDYSLPLEPQIEVARLLLMKRAREWGSVEPRRAKIQTDKFPRYLRLLDFEEAGTRDEEIGRYLFPRKSGDDLRDTIRKNLTAARRWRSDYLIIALHPLAAS